MRFEWDYHNLRHIIDDYPERENTVEEIESIFRDPDLILSVGRRNAVEQRFEAVGRGNSQNVKVAIFSVNNGIIRPISCWSANKQTARYYYENIQGK
ncbi:uncharacterized DUF497 family protein [Dyadobacter sp. BE34]|uniref:Uncharacterized DUF497 family protein n=1 Tax=Dyadobacter fermentans TaxID=94254 RepID=A0ABU1R7Y5_9BACT|nr:uncharacterized DUF497 family protein [Dyadobacter fermentans]MDR7047224.1 uncharacterized DUF497 family protein [Dyadobacter sp. BE242]MDR7201460.1 uncharacterized DUF497 family protein [Dyadobacter sp. BE34]MDR7219330.1 uncharacterized DUF497 family protein [Dyadobacter sp. BE31]MDR7267096.1 uncharacterized DUF497 family protein [Dyadobacter sp. BE32]